MAVQTDVLDLIVVRVDGGICSQIMFVALGLHLKQKFGDAVRIKYDLTWFRECGRDIDGRFVRNWDIPKAFPGLHVEEATAEEVEAFKARHLYDRNDAEAIAAPAYVGGYPSRWPSFSEQRARLRQAFRPELCGHSSRLAAEMQAGPCCAVHVRRGDLANYTVAYGHPATPRYFATAVKIIRLAQPEVRFFFFSDEPDYVRNELLPVLPEGGAYIVAEGNDSGRGYEDLYLLSLAQFVIASVGSLGRMAAQLSEMCRCVIVMSGHGGDEEYSCEKIVLDDLPPSAAAPVCKKGGFWSWLKR